MDMTFLSRLCVIVALGSASHLQAQSAKDEIVIDMPNDPRTPIDRRLHPEYNPIGIVETDIGRGTGWLGNDCIVWTAKHVMGRNKRAIGQKVTFHVGQPESGNSEFKYSVDGVVVASGNSEGKKSDRGDDDWALIKLQKSIGRDVGYITAAQYSVEDALTCKALETAGYPGRKDTNKLWWQGGCSLDIELSGLTAFNLSCAGTPGLSGAPLLCREADGTLYAIGAMSQQLSRGFRALFVNFTSDWSSIKPAFQRVMHTCK